MCIPETPERAGGHFNPLVAFSRLTHATPAKPLVVINEYVSNGADLSKYLWRKYNDSVAFCKTATDEPSVLLNREITSVASSPLCIGDIDDEKEPLIKNGLQCPMIAG
jgi:hypothetical protein